MQEINTGIDWTNPVSEELPAGSSAEYTAEYAELEIATTGSPEQQYGQTVIPAKEPDWQQVLTLATSLSKQTRDLRIALWLTRALTQVHGLAGLKAGLSAVETMLEQYWEHVHPQLTIDGLEDPHLRYGVLCEFGALDGLVSDMRSSSALTSNLGTFTVKDLERISEQGSFDFNGITIGRLQIDQMVSDATQTPQATALLLPGAILESISHITSCVMQALGSEYTPDLSSLQRPLQRIRAILETDSTTQQHGEGTQDKSSQTAGHALTNFSAVGGTLQSRSDVLKTLNAVCIYLEKNEPTNPALLLIRRAEKVMTMSFIDIIKNMTPDGLTQALFLAGEDNTDEGH